MKQSGIDWIGEIPDDWKTRQIRYLFSLRDERNYKPLSEVNLISVYTGKGVLQHSDIEQTTGNKAQNADGYKHVYKNDLVVNIILCWMGALGISDFDGVTSPAYDVYAPKDLNIIFPKYYHYLFRTTQFNGKCYTEGRGIMQMRWRTYSSEFKSIKVPLPPKATQQRIAEYLDKKVSEIDSIIEESKKSIEEYKAWKQSVIFEAVTGKNLNCKKKDSGIEWIGEIPEGWKVRKLKYILENKKNNLKVGPFGSQLSGNDFKTEGFWVYNQRTVLDKNFETNDTFIDENKYKQMEGFHISEKDILITTRGSIGKIVRVPKKFHKGIIHPCIIKFCIDEKKIHYTFLQYIFNESGLLKSQLDYESNSTTIDVIYGYTLKNVYIPSPSLSEQVSITKMLDSKCAQIDSLITEKESLIADLTEYKKSLIFEVVTGKRSV